MAADDHSERPVADAATAKVAAARKAFLEYGLAFFAAGALSGALVVQLIHMAVH